MNIKYVSIDYIMHCIIINVYSLCHCDSVYVWHRRVKQSGKYVHGNKNSEISVWVYITIKLN